jgi:GNAT superfamily N-acetyltransferase
MGTAEVPEGRALSIADISVDVVRAGDLHGLRSAFLSALRDDPHAFISHYSDSTALTEDDWTVMLKSSVWVSARHDGNIIGIARSVPDPEATNSRFVESVWVEKNYRRLGVARDMIELLAAKASDAGVSRLKLWVLDTNKGAYEAYRRLGFELDDVVADTKKSGVNGSVVREQRMSKGLAARDLDAMAERRHVDRDT